MNASITTGTRVKHIDTRTGRPQFGTAVKLETDAYMTVMHGHRVWYVRWDGGNTGGGWREDDLIAA